MSLKVQYFAVDENGLLERIPNRTMERITAHEAMLPDHVDTTVRIAEVLAECDERGVPQRVARIRGLLMKIEEDGLMDEGAFMEGIRLAMNTIDVDPPSSTLIVDLEDAREKRDLERNHRWAPSGAETQLLVSAALGHPKSTPNITTVRVNSKVPRRERLNEARLTYRARSAIEAVRNSIRDINFKVGVLDDEDLVGLEKAVLEEGEGEESFTRAHWEAVAQQVRYRSAIAEAIRTGSGEWYAVVEGIRWTNDHVAETEFSNSRKCGSLEEATSAIRVMLTEAVGSIRAGVSVEARTIPALQFEEEGRR